MHKRRIVCAMATVWSSGCVPQPDETQEIIDNLAQAGFPADDIQVAGGAAITAAVLWLTGGRERRPASPGPRVSVHPRLDLAVRL